MAGRPGHRAHREKPRQGRGAQPRCRGERTHRQAVRPRRAARVRTAARKDVKRSVAVVAMTWAGRALALEAEAGFSHEKLTNHNPDWKSAYVEAAHTFAPRRTLYGALREVERFDLKD